MSKLEKMLAMNPVPYSENQSGGLDIDDLMEIGRSTAEMDEDQWEDLKCRWGEWIILFPGSKKEEGGKEMIPYLYYRDNVDIGSVSGGWRFDWINLDDVEMEDQRFRLGAGFHPFKDINNLYRNGYGALPEVK